MKQTFTLPVQSQECGSTLDQGSLCMAHQVYEAFPHREQFLSKKQNKQKNSNNFVVLN